MNTRDQSFGFERKLIVVALLLAFGPAHADEDLDKLIKPDSTTVSASAGGLSGSTADRTLWGQYNGWGRSDSAVSADFEYLRREEETGTWTKAEGRNLGLDNRELSFSYDRQGQWKVYGEYSELVHHNPRSLNTGMGGVGSAQPAINTLAARSTGATQYLDVKRSSFKIGAESWVNSSFLLEGSVQSETKDGSIQSGIGNYCGPVIAGYRCATTTGALLALAEPVGSTTTQMEGKGTLMGEAYSITLGYYGSIFKNNNGSMRLSGINGGLVDLAGNPVALSYGTNTLGDLLLQPVSLAPDNEAYQFYLSGHYAFTPKINTTFHFAQTHATQNESFAAMGLTAAAGLPGSLGGVVDTSVAQAGITARLWPQLNLLGNVRFEENDDRTPQYLYGGTYVNPNNTSQKANSKAEASYALSPSSRAIVGVDFNWVKRNVPGIGSTQLIIPTGSLTSIRENTTELVYRAELRQTVTENLNGSVALLQSFRNGSHWINLGATSAAYPNTYQPLRWVDVYSASGIFPVNMMDRRRDKVRVMADWTASEKLSLQFNVEQGQDVYSAPTLVGMHSGTMSSLGVDATYALSDNWKLTGFLSYGEQTLDMSQAVGYIARIVNTTTNAGLGVNGKLSSKIDVGADLNVMSDLTGYGMSSGTSAAPGSVPDVSYRSLALRLFAKYALDKQSDIRVDLISQNVNFDEWTWASAGVPFTYSDNTTVATQANQNVAYLGVKYVYRFK